MDRFEKALTVEQLREYLPVSARTLRRWRKAGIGPPWLEVRSPGGKPIFYYPTKAFAEWQEACEGDPLLDGKNPERARKS